MLQSPASPAAFAGLGVLIGLVTGSMTAGVVAAGLLILGVLALRSGLSRSRWRRLSLLGLGAVLVLGALIQVVPYGRSHFNPDRSVEPDWDSPETRSLAVAACFDCHSNLTVWPWYSDIAPLSWSVTSHVEEGRDTLNFSEWDGRQDELDEIAETIREGSMPPWSYRLLQPEARLSSAEKDRLISGLDATLRASPPG
jgi:hypothetical protein